MRRLDGSPPATQSSRHLLIFVYIYIRIRIDLEIKGGDGAVMAGRGVRWRDHQSHQPHLLRHTLSPALKCGRPPKAARTVGGIYIPRSGAAALTKSGPLCVPWRRPGLCDCLRFLQSSPCRRCRCPFPSVWRARKDTRPQDHHKPLLTPNLPNLQTLPIHTHQQN